MLPRNAIVASLALFGLAFSGCLDSDSATDSAPLAIVDPDVLDLAGTMNFTASVVDAALHYGVGLYEPTMDVSDSGVIYVTGHTAGVDTTGAPVFFSKDDGATWAQVPFASNLALPGTVHGGTPPPSDEIFLVAGDNGQLWGVDITLMTYPVNGWCNDADEHCYHNPDAYDEVKAMGTRAGQGCQSLSLNDRPWAAYANDTLLMVNNPGGGPVQVAAMKVPPSQYVDVWNPVTGPVWNLCAGSGGFIPGIPDIRDDGFFAVPQMQGNNLVLVTGNAADVMTVNETTVFEVSHTDVSEISNYGQVVFDADGTMYVSAMANPDEESGAIMLATSTDGGMTFTTRTYEFDRPVSSLYIDGNKAGSGAVINWGLLDAEGTDYFLGHYVVAENGKPAVREATMMVDNGPEASRHVQGAAVGPDGRGYMVMSEVSGNTAAPDVTQAGTNPLTVVLQNAGPTLPIFEVIEDVLEE